MRKDKHWLRLVIFTNFLSLLATSVYALPNGTIARNDSWKESRCMPIPNLYEDWKKSAFSQETSEEKMNESIENQRARARNLQDPFTPIAAMTEEERKRKGEKVLWEDDRVMVLVDQFFSTPKPLIIPKEKMMFPTDAQPKLLTHLAMVAATTADALMLAAGRPCRETNFSRIYINPPMIIGVKQLHVHVQPITPLQDFKKADEFYSLMSKYLGERLSKVTEPQ